MLPYILLPPTTTKTEGSAQKYFIQGDIFPQSITACFHPGGQLLQNTEAGRHLLYEERIHYYTWNKMNEIEIAGYRADNELSKGGGIIQSFCTTIGFLPQESAYF